MEPRETDRIPFPADMPDRANRMGCCGIVAACLFTGASWTEVWSTIRRECRKPGNWRGGTRHHERLKALRKLNKERSAAFRTVRTTLRRWINLHAQDDVTYMVVTTGHVQVIRNGFVYDQSGCWSILEYPGRNKIIRWAMARKTVDVS